MPAKITETAPTENRREYKAELRIGIRLNEMESVLVIAAGSIRRSISSTINREPKNHRLSFRNLLRNGMDNSKRIAAI
jgi:hypothetical protein